MSPIIAAVLAAVHLILLHRPDGIEVVINITQVTSLQSTLAARGGHNRYLPPNTHCVIALADGKFIAVRERCAEVRQLMEAAAP